jgi:hypothetical protein
VTWHLHTTHLSRSSWIPSNTGHHRLEASLRPARLQGLHEVDPARLLAAMLGDLGVSTLRLIKTMTRFYSFEHQTSHAAYFNARGLLYECIFNALLFSSETSFSWRRYLIYFFFSSSFLDHHTGHPAPHDAWILLYECIFDALRIFSSSFRSIGSLLPIDRHSTSLRFAKTSNRSAAKLIWSFLDRCARYSTRR